MQHIYDYRIADYLESEIEAKKITKEFKMSYLDPAKYTVPTYN